jgi:predicted RNase H-like HicB family nuclease
MSSKRYPVVIEKTATGFSAYSPDVIGCVATGDTEEQTRQSFQDALRAHFDVMRQIGERIPEPQTFVDYVEVAA